MFRRVPNRAAATPDSAGRHHDNVTTTTGATITTGDWHHGRLAHPPGPSARLSPLFAGYRPDMQSDPKIPSTTDDDPDVQSSPAGLSEELEDEMDDQNADVGPDADS